MNRILIVFYLASVNANAFAEPTTKHRGLEIGSPTLEKGVKVTRVNWEGYVESGEGHSKNHGHKIKFVRKSDGKSFDIVDSPELEKIHCETSRNLWVSVEAEKTSQFLFGGSNLIVKDFEIIKQLAHVPHMIKYRRHLTQDKRDRVN